MKRTVFTDPYFYNQPSLDFIQDLKKPLHNEKPEYYGKRKIQNGEIDVHGLYIAEKFCDDKENLLETIYSDFALFLKVYEIQDGKKFPIYIKKGNTECFEAYIVEICENCITVTAADTEGVRRALIYLEDELRIAENAFLKPCTVMRKPHIHSRITRCFFSPINRAPKFGDELSDDIDYYPEEYLNRLMHEGSNAVWIYTRFSDLLPSSIITEYGKGYEKRIAKLNGVIEKCRKYGIGVYVFAIEPKSIDDALAEKYSDMVGAKAGDGKSYAFCCSSERGKAYCYEAGKKLTQLCPKLRGLISITYGERATSCSSNIIGASMLYTDGKSRTSNCPRCGKKKNGEVLALALEALKSGTREVNPDFEVISWTYGHRIWEMNDILDYVDYAPNDVMLMQNFEDLLYQEQLGKTRLAEDYWLSCVGPSSMFTQTAQRAKENGKHMFAKMQVCCSHEIASVPFVPVPGILYKKYAAANDYGVEGVMQCWYFGNYPSIMSKAAGELSFTDEFKNEDAFLKRIAGIYFGNSKAEDVVKAWKLFEEGYGNYPINIFFSYFGPMHDSVVWKLALKPKNFVPARTWQLVDPRDGDRIFDTLMSGHTIDEALTLCQKMSDSWNEGIKIIEKIKTEHKDEAEILNVSKAIGILFNGGKNILEFYKLRDELGKGEGIPQNIIKRMKEIVGLEKENSLSMIPLCKECKSLGYHSESEGYKFFPQSILDRVNQLDELIKTEFPEVEQRIAEGKTPLEFYDGIEDAPDLKRYSMPKGNISSAPWEQIGESGKHKFRMSYNDENLYLELYSQSDSVFLVCPEFNLMHADVPMRCRKDGSLFHNVDEFLYWQMFGEKAEKEKAKYRNVQSFDDAEVHLLYTLNLSEIGINKIRPMRMKFVAGGEFWCKEPERPLLPDTMPRAHLGKPEIIPEDYGWIIPQK